MTTPNVFLGLSIFGLVLSLVALGRRPRGFATAGVILGVLGTCGWGLIFIVAGAAILAALGISIVALALTETETIKITADMANTAIAIKQSAARSSPSRCSVSAPMIGRRFSTPFWQPRRLTGLLEVHWKSDAHVATRRQ